MGILKGNYKLKDEVNISEENSSDDKLVEQEYYKAALEKLGGSIAFVLKDKTFLWTGDETPSNADVAVKDRGGKTKNAKSRPSGTKVSGGE